MSELDAKLFRLHFHTKNCRGVSGYACGYSNGAYVELPRDEQQMCDAAHDLYAALERALPFIDDADDVHQVFPESAASPACREAVTLARAALAKARGEK